MSRDHDVDYYLHRGRASVAMSLTAKDPGVRMVHRELARRYADLAGAVDGRADTSAIAQHPGEL